MKKLSLVIPVYNEQEVILQFLRETKAELQKLGITYEYVFVDDGSTDRTAEILKAKAAKDNRIKLVVFSYNHGKAYAVSAAIAYATGEYLLYMDPDLQDSPSDIPRMLKEIEKGYDLVWGIRKEKKDSFWNRQFSKIFWLSLGKFTGLKIPKGIAVFRIFNREFADEFLRYRESNRFIEGIFLSISKKFTTLEVSQRERFAGKTKFNLKRKIQLASDAVFDFSEVPLTFTVRLGMLMVGLGAVGLLGLVVAKLFFVEFQAGWPSVIVAIITAFGMQLFFLGIVSIYIGRIYRETKRRPLFSVKEIINLT